MAVSQVTAVEVARQWGDASVSPPGTDITDRFAVRGPSPVTVALDADEGLVDAPLPTGWVIDGDPHPRMRITATARGGGISSGVWCCQPSRFTFIYDVDEYVHIIAGRVTVIANTHVHELSAGSTAMFPRGLRTEWTVHEPIHKVFVLGTQPRSTRVFRRVRSLFAAALRSSGGARVGH